MKKLVLAFLAFLTLNQAANAQCTPVVDTGFVSPLPQNFPCVVQNTSFNNAVSLNIPASFDLTPFGVPVVLNLQNVTITGVMGLPSGMSYACNPSNCVFVGGQAGCINISGTTSDPVGTYPLTFDGTVTMELPIFLGGGDTTVPLSLLQQAGQNFGYDVEVIANANDPCHAPASIGNALKDNVSVNVFPNPNNGVFDLKITTGNRITGDVVITDAMGREVAREAVDFTDLYYKPFDVSAYAPGLYAVSVRTTTGISSVKFTIK